MKRGLTRAALLLGTLLAGLATVELVLRVVEPARDGELPRAYITTADGIELNDEVVLALGCMVPVPNSPRPRMMFLPGMEIRMCFTGPRQPYFDEQGCVPIHFNSCSIRDREEVCAPKPPGQKRIVCIGDSFTFGWGVRAEDAWVTLVEQILRRRAGDHVRTVNCGAAGALYVDEYAVGLRERFGRFEPDAVVVSLCLNDLINVNGGLTHRGGWESLLEEQAGPPWWHPRLLDALARSWRPPEMPTTYRLDPQRDWVKQLVNMPADHPRYNEMVPREVFWGGGGPQANLRAMAKWCAQRDLPFLVVVWPLFQGLGDHEFYPFTRMHEMVAAFCAQEGIPCLDLLPTFRGHPTTPLWVSPADQHGNHVAQRMAAGPVADFVAAHVDL